MMLYHDCDAGRVVGDPHRTLRLIHILTASTLCSHRRNRQVRRRYLNALDGLYLFFGEIRRYADGCERGMARAGFVKRREADQPMDPSFSLKMAVCIFSFDEDGRRFHTSDSVWASIDCSHCKMNKRRQTWKGLHQLH
jgi:hypothetical protein